MATGLTMNMFDGSLDLMAEGDSPSKQVASASGTEDFFPTTLVPEKLAPCLRGMADVFPQIWPIKAFGDDRTNKMHSPVGNFLTVPLPKKTDVVKETPSAPKRLKVTQLLMTLTELVENEFPLHSSQLAEARNSIGKEETDEDRKLLEKRVSEGWVETDLSKGNGEDRNQAGSILDGKTVYSLDCEMCQTECGLELTRISILDWDGKLIYDTFVKPTNAITDYLTVYSGITKEKLENIATKLPDVQAHLLSLFNHDTILVGQSLNSDLVAMKFSHPHIIDTSCIYHHARGPPYKASLKWLSQRFLKREIQNTGATGHDSAEDAQACLDLLKLKIEKGAKFGTSDDNRESIFKRLTQAPHGKKAAMVDYSDPNKFYGAHATAVLDTTNDDEVVKNVGKCVNGDMEAGLPAMDFTWARLRSLETVRSFSGSNSKSIDIDGPLPDVVRDPPKADLIESVRETVTRIRQIYDAVPKCTAFIVYSGTGDPRQWRCMDDLQRRFKEEYKVRKWDEVGIKWTDVEDQKLKKSLSVARNGVGFMVVK